MATALANAYVNIVPSTSGIRQGIEDALNGSGSSAGKSWGSSFVSAAKKMLGAAAIGKTLKDALDVRGEFEQLAGGVEKIFDAMDTSKIYEDAKNAYKTLGMSANDYLAVINDVGASFSASMGDAKAYSTAKQGLQAISDYASGTGKNFDVLKEKFAMITRATSSYQSIADQFSGILPATSVSFLEQAQAAGILSKSYSKLTEVPIDEYQQAVAAMLAKGTEALNLTSNTAMEAESTLTGSIAALKAVWSNFLAGNATGEELAKALTAAFANVSRTVVEMLPELAKGVVELIKGLYPIVKQQVSRLIRKVPEYAAELPKAIERIGGQIRANMPAIIQAITEMGQNVINALPGIINSVWQYALTLLRSIISQIPNEYLPIVAGITTAAATVAAFIAGGSVVGKIIAAGKNLIAGAKALWAVLAANPVVAIIAVVAGLVAALITAYQTNDEFRAKVDALWETLKGLWNAAVEWIKAIPEKVTELKDKVIDTFNSIKDAIKEKIEAARDFVKEAIEKIKSFFNFEWSLPKLRLPHFSISGSFSLDPPSIPKINVSWYKKAMNKAYLLNSATIFGARGGKLLGGGEAGSEMIIGRGTLLGMISDAVTRGNSGESARTNELLAEIQKEIRGLELVVNNITQLDGREIGKTAHKYSVSRARSVGGIA